MKAGSRGPLAKALGLGNKTPEACATDGIVLSIMPACCCVYVHWGKMARKVNKRHHLAAPTVFVDPCVDPSTSPVVVVVSPLSVVLCAAHTQCHTQYPPTRTGLSRRPLSIVPASVAGFVVVGASASLWGSLLLHHHRARPASFLFWSCPLAH